MRFCAPVLIALASTCVLMSGCSDVRTLDGTWASEGEVPTTMTIKGTDYKSVANAMGNAITVTGKAAYDDENGKLKITDLKVDASGAPPAMADAISSGLPKQIEVNVTWRNRDEISFTSSASGAMGAAGTYKRQKN